MRIENLKVGMVLKNYKHLCSLLCIEPKGKAGSNSRIAQIKEINRSVKYKKLEGGNKLVILEIYNELKDSGLIKDNEEILSDEQLEGCSNTLLEIFRNDPEIQEYSKQLLNMLITGDAQLDI